MSRASKSSGHRRPVPGRAARPARPPAPAAPRFETAEACSGPQKIHKVLAQAGLGSRREMEEWIRAGKVKVNGALAQVGMRVQAGDVIRVGRRQVTVRGDSKLPRIILYHKPEGEIVSHDDPQGRPSVFDKLPPMRRGKWLAIGRLDYNTSGLLIFTTSGELANRLMHPRYEVDREYAVRVIGKLTEERIRQLTRGVRLEDGMARFEVLEERGGRGLNNWYRVVLREGRNRIVRRMFDAVGYKVSRLMRVRFGIVSLPFGLRRGGWREPDAQQTAAILDWSATLAAPAAEPLAVRARIVRSAGSARAERPDRRRPWSTAR
jgi:23S rRNA pseudouridine2605 synthase